MKIAVATNDGMTIAEHFGGSSIILVISVEDGQVVKRELREKPGHVTFAGQEDHPQTDEKGRHGFGSVAEQRHRTLFEIFQDCEVLIAGKMGTGAYTQFVSSGVRVIATDIKSIDWAVDLYIKGGLNHIDTLLD